MSHGAGRARGASVPFRVKAEEVAEAALGADELGVRGIALDLAAQTQDQHVDGAVEGVAFLAAQVLKQLVAGLHASFNRLSRTHSGFS